MADGRYFCEVCTARYEAAGDCSECPGEPLLDLADEDVRLMIQDFDDRRWRKRATQWTLASIVVMIPVAAPLAWVLPFKYTVLAWAFGTAGVSTFLSKNFAPEPKMPELSDEDIRRFGQ